MMVGPYEKLGIKPGSATCKYFTHRSRVRVVGEERREREEYTAGRQEREREERIERRVYSR